MNLHEFNRLPEKDALVSILACCHAPEWAHQLIAARPFDKLNDLILSADSFWHKAQKPDVMKAFDAHPKIGDVSSLKLKYANTQSWAGHEQKNVEHATTDVIEELAELNSVYERKFGYIFIVCATGKSALEMLEILKARVNNHDQKEYLIAKEEQRKIYHIRLHKLIEPMTQITTHVLDTSIGKPAEGVSIKLQRQISQSEWSDITSGVTNSDGRITNFLSDEQTIENGVYRMVFEPTDYFNKQHVKAFYPYIPVVFEIKERGHYHVPLLLNPFGYSTYRGS